MAGESVCDRPHGELALAEYASPPQKWEGLLAAELTEAGTAQDEDLAAAAKALMVHVDQPGAKSDKYNVTIKAARRASRAAATARPPALSLRRRQRRLAGAKHKSWAAWRPASSICAGGPSLLPLPGLSRPVSTRQGRLWPQGSRTRRTAWSTHAKTTLTEFDRPRSWQLLETGTRRACSHPQGGAATGDGQAHEGAVRARRRAGQHQHAATVARSITNPDRQAQTLATVAEALAARGETR